MPDISMCLGGDCPLRKDCYRYRAVPYKRQIYITQPPIVDNECENFWQIEEKHRVRDMCEIENKLKIY